MIFSIIGILLIIYSFKNFKKAFLWLLIFKLFLVTNITVIAIPGIPLLTLDLCLTMFFFIRFYYIKDKLQTDKTPFPLKKPFLYCTVSWLLSTIFAYVGFTTAVSAFVKALFTNVIFIWMLWKLINSKQDIRFLLRWLPIAFLFISIYGVYEHFMEINPLVEYEANILNDEDRAVIFTYNSESFRGYRVQSVFEHAIGAGINWAMYIVMFLYFIIEQRSYIVRKNLVYVTIFLSLLCIVFTNSRGPILFGLISILSIVNLKNKRIYYLISFGVLAYFLLAPLLADYSSNLLSIFDSKQQEKVGGSNAEMRFDQLSAAVLLMQESPLVGLGFKFTNELSNVLVDRLLGMESIWFGIMTQFGLIGVAANLVLAYYSLIKIPLQYKSKQIFFLSLAYWITASLTSVPGMLMYFYYLIIFIFIRIKTKWEVKL